MSHPSAAFGDFRDAMSTAERLAQIEHRYRDPPTAESAATVEALRGGFCVLIVGAFERFLSDAFQEHLSPLAANPPPVAFSRLPEKLRLTSVWRSLEGALSGPRYGAPSKRAARLPDVMAAATKVVSGQIDPVALAATQGNPSAATVKEMFGCLGIGDVFTATRPAFDALWAQPESATFVQDRLQQIVNARHVVAHTASALGLSRHDLQTWPNFLSTLATVLDARLDLFVRNIISGVKPP